ncbi:MAG: inorganic polyphosphate kinase [Butyricicoccus sp.]|nr:inorganic polyphosphate kinase [Butyricicoccus sp.]
MLLPYKLIGWLDHVKDIITGEVIQEGTPVSQSRMNHMDDGIFVNREAVILHEAQIADAEKEIKVLKDATFNNMVNNVFLINFDSMASVDIISGIFDPKARKIYV